MNPKWRSYLKKDFPRKLRNFFSDLPGEELSVPTFQIDIKK